MGILGKLLLLRRRALAALRGSRGDDELQDEIRQHLELRTQALIDEGRDPREAAREALRLFGNPLRIRDETRDMIGFRWFETLRQDLRYGIRLMARSPTFSVVAVISVAVGIAATTVVVGIVNAALWRWSAMYHEPDRLVYLWQTREAEIWTPTPADFRDWRAMATSFSNVEAYTYRTLNYSGGTEPEQLRAAAVTPEMFAALGVRPLVGSSFNGDEETWGRHRRVLLGEALWRRKFGSDPAVIGRTLTLDGQPYDVAGVMPAGTWFSTARPEVFVPLAFAPDDPSNNRNSHFVWVVARLRGGVSFEVAAAEMRIIASRLEAVHPANKGLGARPVRMAEQVLADPSRRLMILAAAVVLVLFIASANVATLLIVRATARQRELAVRASLGATRGRIARQVLTEGMVLAVAGGILGLALAAVATRVLPGALPEDLPRIAETGIPLDWRVLTVSALSVIGCGVLIGSLPALTTVRWKTTDPLKESARTSHGGRNQSRIRAILIAAEIALALVLVVGATLLIRSFINLQHTELGVRTNDLLTVRVPLAPGGGAAANAAETSAYLDRIAAQARTVPGVLSADITSHVPLGGGGQSKHFFIVGKPLPARYEDVPTISLRQEGPQSLQTMGVALLSGRHFSESDRAGALPVAIVNKTLATRFFGASDPVGQVICLQAPEHLSPPDNVILAGGSFVRWTVVGVVGDVRYTHPSEPVEAVVYVPYRQRTQQALMGWAPDYLVLHSLPGATVMPTLRQRLREIAPSQPVADVRSIEMLVGESLAGARVIALGLSLFSGVALFLACVGIYGSVASVVSMRTSEIALRVALGARPSRIVWLVLRQAAALAVVGVAGGSLAALGAAEGMESQLYGVRAADVTAFSFAPLIVFGVSSLAAWIPGRRAARIDPSTALRNE